MSYVGRDAWKKKYFEEKRKTVPLEEESRRLRNELDAAHRKILAQLEKAHDGQQSSTGLHPSQQVNVRTGTIIESIEYGLQTSTTTRL